MSNDERFNRKPMGPSREPKRARLERIPSTSDFLLPSQSIPPTPIGLNPKKLFCDEVLDDDEVVATQPDNNSDDIIPLGVSPPDVFIDETNMLPELEIFSPSVLTQFPPIVIEEPNMIDAEIAHTLSTSSNSAFRFQGRKIGLTYSCPKFGMCLALSRHTAECTCVNPINSAQELADHLVSIWPDCEYCISEEIHGSNGKKHFHAFLKWPIKRETTSQSKFDFKGVHPNILIPRGNGTKWINYIIKEGKINCPSLKSICIYIN